MTDFDFHMTINWDVGCRSRETRPWPLLQHTCIMIPRYLNAEVNRLLSMQYIYALPSQKSKVINWCPKYIFPLMFRLLLLGVKLIPGHSWLSIIWRQYNDKTSPGFLEVFGMKKIILTNRLIWKNKKLAKNKLNS